MDKRWLAGATTFGAATLIFGAAALAQTPVQGVSAAQATTTTTQTVVMTGTVGTATNTAVAGTQTPVITGTVGVTGTVTAIPTVPVSSELYQPGGGPFAFADPAFQSVWNRTDALVKRGQVSRTWFWGPGPDTPGLFEAYQQDPLGRGQRLVQYFDKSRMEVNNPRANPKDQFYVTNGLLTVDLISGSIQVGDNQFQKYRNACIPMTGDFGDIHAPTYFAFQKVSVSSDRVDTHPATDQVGKRVTATIDRNGTVGNDASKSNLTEGTIAFYDSVTKHNIPKAFWDFLNSKGPVLNDSGQVVSEQLINPWFYASGRPISEAYWTKATIRGTLTDVLVQAFERRALTYVATNQPGWQVEMANIGQHYFDWRYRNAGFCPGQPVTTPTPPVPAGTTTPGPAATGTVVTTGTAVPTGTAAATGTPTTTPPAQPTGTVTVPPVPIANSPTPTP